MYAPTVKDIQVREKDVQALKEVVYALTARPLDDVRVEVEARVRKYLDQVNPKSEPLTFPHKVKSGNMPPAAAG